MVSRIAEPKLGSQEFLLIWVVALFPMPNEESCIVEKYGPSLKTLNFSSRFEMITMKNPFAPSLRLIWPFGCHICWIHLINSFSISHAPLNLQMRAWSFMYFQYSSILLLKIMNLGFLATFGSNFPPKPACHLACKTEIPLPLSPFPQIAPCWLDYPVAMFL